MFEYLHCSYIFLQPVIYLAAIRSYLIHSCGINELDAEHAAIRLTNHGMGLDDLLDGAKGNLRSYFSGIFSYCGIRAELAVSWAWVGRV